MSIHPFLAKLTQTITTEVAIARGSRGVAAVSGGADSVALLIGLNELAKEQGWEVVVGHVEHGIRGAESLADADFVRGLAGKLGLKFVVKSADVPGGMRAGESMESAARRVRYALLEECAAEEKCDWVATAHTADDNAETVMMNLMRGAGPTGMGGIPLERAIRKGSPIRVVRPLLRHRRAEVEEFLRERGQEWRTDESNFDRKYLRNVVRHDVLPMMEAEEGGEGGDVVERLNELAATVGKLANMLKEESAGLKDEVRLDEGDGAGLRCERLSALPALLAGEVVRDALEEVAGSLTGFDRGHIEEVLRLAREGRPGTEVALPRGVRAYRDYERVILAIGSVRDGSARLRQQATPRRSFGPLEMSVPGEARLEKPGAEFRAEVEDRGGRTIENLLAGKDRWSEWVDAGKVGERLEIRSRRPGDRFRPLGAPGERKLQDFLTDRKLARRLREGWPIVSAGDKIVWVVGLGIGEEFKVGPETKRLARISVRWEEEKRVD